MKTKNLTMLTATFALLAVSGGAAASPASCGDTTLDAGRARPEQLAHDAEMRAPAGVVRAVYNVPRPSAERPRQQPVQRIPEPGGWATLVAGLLGLGTIVRRRMP